jgi:transposase
VVDAQSVKTSANVPETSQGIDAGKKIKGRKRHLITDTLGLVLAVLITAANVHDTTGGKLLLDDVATNHPSVSKVWADGGYQNSIFNHGAGLGIDVEVVQRPRAKGFEPLPKRWVIERTFGWRMQHRRLARDYEALPQRSRAMIHWAMAKQNVPRTAGRIHANLANRNGHPTHICLNIDQMPSLQLPQVASLSAKTRHCAHHPREDRPATAPAEARLPRRPTARVRPGDLPAAQDDRALLQPAQGLPRYRHQIREDRHLLRSGGHPRIVPALG